MRTEQTPKEAPEESTSAASLDELSFNEVTEELSQIEVMDLHGVTRVIDSCLFRLSQPREGDTPAQLNYLRDQLQKAAIELASHVLSVESCEQLGIKAEILDNQSFDHPPIREDVFRLAAAAEALDDDTLKRVYEVAIDELPDGLYNVKRRARRALGLVNSGRSDTFHHAYAQIELIDAGNETDGREIMASHAKRFFDHNQLDAGIDYNELDRDDERMERLVNPIPTSFEGNYGTHDEPRVEFYVSKDTKKKLADEALKETVKD